ncbi:MAG: AarF/ABC1/UbiB kinase family protein [candidate division KSB1 bacterium]|nr:AarF/ABC1/UbiB kinase family protein [candidate division KSB1 bacterium]
MKRLLSKLKKIRHFSRYQQLVTILVKYGFEDALNRYKISRLLYKKSRVLLRKESKKQMHRSSAQRIRLALQEMGPTFIKFGQMLSTRFDLLPVHVIEELQKLQDEVEPFSGVQCVQIIEKELGLSLNDIFAEFENDPRAAASLAQVHKARTHDGQVVVIKVQRPDIQKQIKQDIEILKDLADWTVKHVPNRMFIHPSELVSEFESWIQDELDFKQEARNMYRFGENFKNDNTLYVPEVFWQYTSGKVITMTFVEGIRIDHVESLKKAGLDPGIIANNGTIAALRQIFEHRFFHGDPHPGNIFVTFDGKIVPIDFGLVGRLDQSMVMLGGELLMGIVNRDSDTVSQVLIRLNRLDTDVNENAMRIDVYNFLDRYYGVPANQLLFEHLFYDLVNLIKTHNIQLPRNLYLVGKALLLMEYLARKLDENFNLFTVAEPYVDSVIRKKMGPSFWAEQTKQSAQDYAGVLLDVPRTLKKIMRKSSSGNISVTLQHQGLTDLMNEIGRSSNRLSFSLIIASLIIGSSLIIRTGMGPVVWGVSIVGLVGYILAGMMGLLLLLRIWRSEQF